VKVKSYRIQIVRGGGIKFTCTHCPFSVNTLDFDAKAGHVRTQAATAINAHATQAHRGLTIIFPASQLSR
jgi:hypothetical protein